MCWKKQRFHRRGILEVTSVKTASKFECSKVLRGEERPTKRMVLSIVMAQFDPTGFLAPVTILVKMLVQDLWRTGCQWDDAVDDLSYKKWTRWTSDDAVDDLSYKKWTRWTSMLAIVQAFKLPRSCFGTARSDEIRGLQLHIFADVGETGYGCVAYFRAMVRGEVECALVMCRAKVAPLKQVSIPRL
ncbi:uncharacterized protein LOC134206801 [Armigeres subalbatus]|uniref:uncharacterized protein LOC134206801 n=1 Tax=Armigeres subalbatus TaxID=124917 RepID=UPI002ED435C3